MRIRLITDLREANLKQVTPGAREMSVCGEAAILITYFNKKLKERDTTKSYNIDIVLTCETGKICYYIADHCHQVVFWLHKVAPQEIWEPIIGISSGQCEPQVKEIIAGIWP